MLVAHFDLAVAFGTRVAPLLRNLTQPGGLLPGFGKRYSLNRSKTDYLCLSGDHDPQGPGLRAAFRDRQIEPAAVGIPPRLCHTFDVQGLQLLLDVSTRSLASHYEVQIRVQFISRLVDIGPHR